MRFKKTILAGLLSCMLIPAAFAGDQPKTVIPAKSGLKKFSKLHEEKLAEAEAGQVDWVMIGDSITHAWGRDYKGTFAGSNLLNLGFPGDGTEHVLWRIQHGALDGISPKLVTLLIGTNNLRPAKGLHTPDKPEDVFAGIQAIVAEVRTRLPESKLMVFSVFPRCPQPANDRVVALNAMLPQLTDHEHVFHVDLNAALLDDQGRQNEAYYSKDGVHLIAAGYAAWAKALQPLLEKEGLKIDPTVPATRVKRKGGDATESQWHGYTRQNFTFKGHRCFITQPNKALPSKPWVWRAKFPGYHDEVDKILVGQGFHVAHINCGAMLGSPKARDLWDAFYTYVTETAGLSKTVALEAVSRGGLYAYGWAARNPEKVTCIYGDTPVLDFKSWPGGKGKGIGSDGEWKNLQKQYGFSEEQAMESKDIPLNKLEPLAKAGIPILHVISLVDRVVPAEENSLILEKRYRALGGSVTILPNQKGKYSCNGHHFPLDDPQRCAKFIRDNTPLPRLAGSRPNPSTSLRARRPNIILVMTDDQGMGDLSCMGNPILKTPHLDKFHELSTRFREFHVSPACAPTRSAIFSGRHEFRNGVTHTIHERDRMALSTTTFPKLLARNGYETGIFGKWHLGDEDEYQPYNRGFTEVFIHGAGGIGQSYKGSCGDFPPNRTMPGKYFDNVLLHNDTIVQTKGFCTDVFFQAALGWIKKQHEAEKPFFAYISPNAPHGPMIAPDKYKKRWLDAGWDQNTAGRYGMIENIDDNFGLLMQKLDEWDAWDNTLVIFMTDNGQAGRGGKKNGKPQKMFMAGFKSGKCSAYEGGSHVPAFWRWKGVLGEGVDINALCAHIDFYKTFCELAGVEIPDGIQKIDGRSMLPLLNNPKAEWADRELFTHVGRWHKNEDPNRSRDKNCAVRTQKWRLVGDKLYDIENDPFEATSVASEYPEVMKRLRSSYLKWWKETVPFMVNEDQPYPSENPQAVRYEKQLKERGIPDWVVPEL